MTASIAIARRVVRRTITVLLGVLPTVVAVSAVDRGGDFWPPGTVAMLVGPLCAAVGVAWALSDLRAEGAWQAATSLGHPPAELLLPTVVLLVAVGAASLLTTGPAPSVGIARIAPIPTGAAVWWDGREWVSPPPNHQVPPAELSTSALVRRWTSPAPPGARRGVDAGELVRRGGWAAAYPIGGLAAMFVVLARRPRRGERNGSGPLWATATTATWLVGVLTLSAYASSIT